MNAVRDKHGDAVRLGMSGNVYTGLLEQNSIRDGMLLAASITVVLVWRGLIAYYRSFWAVMAVLLALMVGCLLTFGLTKIFVGHLNLATAFLASIVIGNGINPNIVLLSRYFEELRGGKKGAPALAAALSGAFRGTLAASSAAAVAYGSLIVTNFHFGIIGSMGMVICWLAAFSVLPAALSMLSRRAAVKVPEEPAINAALARLFPERSWLVAIGGLVFTIAAGTLTAIYLLGDPLEEDWRNLRSTSRDILVARQWNDKIAERYEENPAKGVSSRFIVATSSLAQAGEVSQILRSLAEGQAPEERLLKSLPQALHGTHDDIGEQSNRGPRHRVGQLGLHVVDVVASAAHRRKYRGV